MFYHSPFVMQEDTMEKDFDAILKTECRSQKNV